MQRAGALLPWPTWAVQRPGEGGGGSGKEVSQGAVCDSESPTQVQGEAGGPQRWRARDSHRKTAAASPWEHDSGHHGKASLRRVLPVSGSMGQSC